MSPLRGPALPPAWGDTIAINRHIAGKRVGVVVVEDGAAADDDVVHLASAAYFNHCAAGAGAG